MRFVEDKWLSEVINKSAFSVTFDKSENTDSVELEKFFKNLKSHSFVYAKVDVVDLNHTKFLESKGFCLVDTSVSFEVSAKNFTVRPNELNVRFAIAEDKNPTVELAKNTFLYSRFHLDQNFSKSEADQIKAEWIRDYFMGNRGDKLVVAEVNSNVAGYLLLLNKGSGKWVIDLIGVDEKHRGKGIGSSLIKFAIGHCKDLESLTVSTQIANQPSIRLYEKLGFRFESAKYVLHYHNP